MTQRDPTQGDPTQRDPEERYEHAARRIQFLLENHRLATHEAARQLGVRKTVLQDVLDGRSLPTEGFLRKVAAHFQVEMDFLVGPTEIAEPVPPSAPISPRAARGPARPPSASQAPRGGARSPNPEPGPRPTPASAAPRGGAASKSGRPTTSLRTLAVRHQALVELLVSKGVMTAAEYRAQVERIDDRTGSTA